MSMDPQSRQYLRVARHYKSLPVGPSRILLQSHLGSVLLQEPWATGVLHDLVPLLNGQRRWDDIVTHMDTLGFSQEDVVAVLNTLEQQGLLERIDEDARPALGQEESVRYGDPLTVFAHFSRNEVQVQKTLLESRVLIVGLGTMGSNLARVLALSGVGCIGGVDERLVGDQDLYGDTWYTPDELNQQRALIVAQKVKVTNPQVEFRPFPESFLQVDSLTGLLADYDVAVLAVDEYVPQAYETMNEACLKTGTIWTSSRLQGFEVEVGPTVIPHETPCFTCFTSRRRANTRDYEDRMLLESYAEEHPFHWESLPVSLGGQVAGLEIIKLLTGCITAATLGKVFSLHLMTLESRLAPVLKLPRCPQCSPGASRPKPVIWGGG